MRVNIGELGMKDMYEYYKANTPNPVSYKEYKAINEEYIEEITKLILEGHNYKIPSKLGYFRIRKYKTDFTKLAVDYKSTKELGFTVYYLNDHSDGYRVKYLWEKKRAILKRDAKRPYSFTPARDLKRSLAKVMNAPNGHTRYAEELLNQKFIPL